jgi:ATP-dependent DNA ligase
MTDKVTLYHRTKLGQVKVWSIWYDAKRFVIHRQWGMKDGKMTQTKETIKAKQGQTAEERMIRMVENHITARLEEGYVLKLNNVRQSILVRKHEIDFTKLPLEFAPQKPVREFAPIPSRDYIFQRKRDGQRHYVLITDTGAVRLYSRKLEDKTDHMPRIVAALKALGLPPCTVLDGEIICDRDGEDDFRSTGTVCRAGAAVGMRNEKGLPLKFMAFDILFHHEGEVWKGPYKQRLQLLREFIPKDGDRLCLPECFDLFSQAKLKVKKHKWEGLVCWDANAPAVLRMNGKPARAGCYKWKPLQEGDFVAIGWEPGKGRLETTMGKLKIAEWQKGKLVEIGTVGSGFDDKQRDEAMRWKYPLVVELEYDKQEEDSRALRFPVFVRVHPDKTPEELR